MADTLPVAATTARASALRARVLRPSLFLTFIGLPLFLFSMAYETFRVLLQRRVPISPSCIHRLDPSRSVQRFLS
jgi:hypothetical protein